ncbi:MAG: DNA repair exonuclease [Gammaproteobacteria bacterium]
MRFIHAADLHLDSPLRGLDRYEGAPVERIRGATRRALENLVDLALAEEVDFVLLAGDIYDGDWQDFHTGLFFRGQMVRLGRAGIRVFIVQGNHDAQSVITKRLVMPDNVTVFPSRVATTVELEALGAAVHGRSFPNRAVDEDLVPGYPAPRPGWFNIGLLHTSLTGRAGHDTYAPTQPATLTAKGYDYWALGHVHAREVVSASPRIVFPGNLQGRHANETGPKGCELVAVEGGAISAEFVALDVVRWHQVEVALDGDDDLVAVAARFRAAVEPQLVAAPDRLHALRVRLTGASALHALEARSPGTLAAQVQAAAQDLGEADVWIEQVRVELAAPFDRAAQLARDDAIGELVRLVDTIAADEAQLRGFIDTELGRLLRELPPELGDATVALDSDAAALRSLLADAEATVLARLLAERDD